MADQIMTKCTCGILWYQEVWLGLSILVTLTVKSLDVLESRGKQQLWQPLEGQDHAFC